MGIQNLGDQNLRYQKKGSHYGMVYMCPLNMLDDMCVIMELQEPDLFTILTFKIYLLINFPRLFDDWNWTDFSKKSIIFIIPQQHFVVPGDIGSGSAVQIMLSGFTDTPKVIDWDQKESGKVEEKLNYEC